MGLASWDQLGDNYSYAQLANNFQLIDFHDHSAGRGVQIPAGGLAPGSVLSNNIAANQVGVQHLSLSALQNLGLNQSGNTGQGYVSISTSQTTTSASYVYLTTPDQIAGVTITTGGLIFVAYQAMWADTVASAGNAAIFLGSNQVTMATTSTTSPQALAATTSSTANAVRPLVSSASAGLASDTGTTSYTGNVTTGQILGDNNVAWGVATIFAAAGTYTVGIQFKTSSGTLTVSNRQLWVWTRNFN